MEIYIVAGIAVLMILTFVYGIDTGVKISSGDVHKVNKKQKTETALLEPEEPSEDEKRRFEEEQKAFAQCMNYSLEKAYGKSEV